ncbi:hypothetical protein AGLY_007454, partial [Aphis glycines]
MSFTVTGQRLLPMTSNNLLGNSVPCISRQGVVLSMSSTQCCIGLGPNLTIAVDAIGTNILFNLTTGSIIYRYVQNKARLSSLFHSSQISLKIRYGLDLAKKITKLGRSSKKLILSGYKLHISNINRQCGLVQYLRVIEFSRRLYNMGLLTSVKTLVLFFYLNLWCQTTAITGVAWGRCAPLVKAIKSYCADRKYTLIFFILNCDISCTHFMRYSYSTKYLTLKILLRANIK